MTPELQIYDPAGKVPADEGWIPFKPSGMIITPISLTINLWTNDVPFKWSWSYTKPSLSVLTFAALQKADTDPNPIYNVPLSDYQISYSNNFFVGGVPLAADSQGNLPPIMSPDPSTNWSASTPPDASLQLPTDPSAAKLIETVTDGSTPREFDDTSGIDF